jgi:hypothetical protein
MAQIEITVSGRIPKYFFGVLNEKYRSEVKDALQYCSEDIKTENDFLNLVFALTLDGFNDSQEALFNAISKEDLEKLPNFNELVNNFIESGEGHFQMIDWLFDYPNIRDYGFYYGISLFEDDAYITIKNSETDEVLTEETRLSDFISSGQEQIWAEEVKEGYEGYEDLQKINQLKSENPKFGFSEDDYFNWRKNELGSIFLSDRLSYPVFVKFTEAHPKEQQVTIYFDDITDWTFFIDTEEEDFDFKKITFVSYPGAEDFRNSACDIVFSHIFYNNQIIEPEENQIRDKGITLLYGESRGLERLDFFLYG